jgi:hypothetical protein
MTSTKADQFNTRQFNRDSALERDLLADHLAAGEYIDEFTYLVESPSRNPLRAGINSIWALVFVPLALALGSRSSVGDRK